MSLEEGFEIEGLELPPEIRMIFGWLKSIPEIKHEIGVLENQIDNLAFEKTAQEVRVKGLRAVERIISPREDSESIQSVRESMGAIEVQIQDVADTQPDRIHNARKQVAVIGNAAFRETDDIVLAIDFAKTVGMEAIERMSQKHELGL